MNYYVYTLAYPDGVVFYVGKGKGKRIADHEKEALRGHTCPKCELIRSIWREGGTVQRAIVFETDDEQAALTHEMELIDSYGPDQLINQCGGFPTMIHTLSHVLQRARGCMHASAMPAGSHGGPIINNTGNSHTRIDHTYCRPQWRVRRCRSAHNNTP